MSTNPLKSNADGCEYADNNPPMMVDASGPGIFGEAQEYAIGMSVGQKEYEKYPEHERKWCLSILEGTGEKAAALLDAFWNRQSKEENALAFLALVSIPPREVAAPVARIAEARNDGRKLFLVYMA